MDIPRLSEDLEELKGVIQADNEGYEFDEGQYPNSENEAVIWDEFGYARFHLVTVDGTNEWVPLEIGARRL
jgi:hypothetical protein